MERRIVLFAIVLAFLLSIMTPALALGLADAQRHGNVELLAAARLERQNRNLTGFTGEHTLDSDGTPVRVIVLFESDPAAVQVLEAQQEGSVLSESTAERNAGMDHSLFNTELTELFGEQAGSRSLPYEINWEYNIAVNGVSITLPSNMVAEVAGFNSVRAVYPDYMMEYELPPVIEPSNAISPAAGILPAADLMLPAGVAPGRASMQADMLHLTNIMGAGVVVAVLDTGIYYKHPVFQGAFPTVAEMQTRGADITDADGINIDGTYYFVGRNLFSGRYENPTNDPSEVEPGVPLGTSTIGGEGTQHGTHVAGIIAGRNTGGATSMLGVAPQAKLFVYRMLTRTNASTGMTYASETIAMYEQVALDKPDVVNMSYGTTGQNTATALSSVAINNVMIANPNMVFVASSGNSGPGEYSLTSPGPGSNYITVASIDMGTWVVVAGSGGRQRFDYNTNPSAWRVTSGSSRGPAGQSFEIKPDIGAHGQAVLSAIPPWVTTNLPVGAENLNFASGTSPATAHITGAAALLVQFARDHYGEDWSAAEIKTRLMNTALPFGSGVGVFDAGAGCADVFTAVNAVTVVSAVYDRVASGNIIFPFPTPPYNSIAFTETRTGSFSFGNIGRLGEINSLSLLSKPFPNVRKLTAGITNKSMVARTYTIEEVFTRNPNTAATLTISRRNITVEPGQTEDFTVTISVKGAVPQGYYEGQIFVREPDRPVPAARLPFALVCESFVDVPAYELRFDLSGQSEVLFPIDPINVLTGTPVLDFLLSCHDGFSAVGPVRDGYNFTGWFLDGEIQTALTSDIDMPDGDLTLYAGWTLLVDEITGAALTINAPLVGEIPSAEITGGAGYTAVLKWEHGDAAFTCTGDYTAVITLSTDGNYTFPESLDSTEALSGFTINGFSVIFVSRSEDGSQLVFTVTFDKYGHEYEQVIIPPTCTEPGYPSGSCTRCGDMSTEIIPALGHAWDDGVVTVKPTYTSDGVLLFTCTRCWDTCYESIEALPVTTTPSPSPSPQPSPTPSPQPSPTPSPQPSPTPSPQPSPTPSPQPSPTPSPHPSPTPSPQPSPTPTPQSLPTPSPQPSPTPLPQPSQAVLPAGSSPSPLATTPPITATPPDPTPEDIVEDDAESESEITIIDGEVPLIDLPLIEDEENDNDFSSTLVLAIIITVLIMITGAILLVIRKKRSRV